jgi:hypothetical protein
MGIFQTNEVVMLIPLVDRLKNKKNGTGIIILLLAVAVALLAGGIILLFA